MVRLPGSGGSPIWTIVLLLGAAFLLTTLLNSLTSIAGRIGSLIGPLIGLLTLALVIYGINFLRGGDEIEPSGDTITVEIGEDDCESQILDRCPTQDGEGDVIDTVPPGG